MSEHIANTPAEVAVQAVHEAAVSEAVAEVAAGDAQQAAVDAQEASLAAAVEARRAVQITGDMLDEFQSRIDARFSEFSAQHEQHMQRLEALEVAQAEPSTVIVEEISTDPEEITTTLEQTPSEIEATHTTETPARTRRFRRI
jgi:ABC-type phosphate transport system auxiliary subunit